MGRISRLPEELCNQIAAGEVVERPASAVKELLENAIDAGASRCDVAIEGGGITLISVQDDGGGMDREDAVLCLERHATSKISSFEELVQIQTFGFRGEALPSIASVSRVRLRTRSENEEIGTEVCKEPGSDIKVGPASLARGTLVEIADLFFNVPARRKFLRSSGTEAGHVSEVVEQAALARPEMTFTLRRDGRLTREWLRVAERAEGALRVFENEELMPCRGERGPLKIEAYLSRPERARSGGGGLKLFVNDRPVRDRTLLYTVAQAYGSVLERGRYPRGVVYVDLPPTFVDVNVHPQKSEVRFADARAVADAVYGVLSRELARALSLPTPARHAWAKRPTPVPEMRVADVQSPEPIEPPTRSPEPTRHLPATAPAAQLAQTTLDLSEPDRPPSELAWQARSALPQRAQEEGEPKRWSALKFIAQLRRTFLLCEGDDGLYMLDQHAAAERVTFHRLREQYLAQEVAAQVLLFPTTLELDPADSEAVREREADFRRFGLDVSARDNGTVTIHSTPKLLQRGSAERLFRDLLAELGRQGRSFSAAVDLSLATMACHGSLRAGDQVSANEAKVLLDALDNVDFASNCPHGRPIVSMTSWASLERRVGRR